MSRSLATGLSVLALVFVGCSADEDHHHHHRGNDNPTVDQCAARISCGSCTPVVGCGWCDYGGGNGACVSHPDACGTEQFKWTWEPAGCSTAVVDSGAPGDAATDAPASDSPSSDAPASDAPASEVASDAPASDTSDAAATCSAPSTGLGGCVPLSGGSICKSSEYSLGCHGDAKSIPAPDVSLNCKVAPIASPSDSTYYCCPCSPS